MLGLGEADDFSVPGNNHSGCWVPPGTFRLPILSRFGLADMVRLADVERMRKSHPTFFLFFSGRGRRGGYGEGLAFHGAGYGLT